MNPTGPVAELSHVTLTCSSEANPAVQHYHWYKADEGALTLIGNSAVLNFRASKDFSNILCEALNDLGTDRSSVTQLLINCRFNYCFESHCLVPELNWFHIKPVLLILLKINPETPE